MVLDKVINQLHDKFPAVTPWRNEVPAVLDAVRNAQTDDEALQAIDSFAERQVLRMLALDTANEIADERGVDLDELLTAIALRDASTEGACFPSTKDLQER